MSLRHLFVIFSLALVNVFVPIHAAAIGFQPVSPEELKMTSEPQAPGAHAIILYRQVDVDDNGRTSHEDDYYRIKILTEVGRKYANIEIPFSGRGGTIDNIRARTIRPDGSIANFDGKVFEKSIVKAKNLKVLAKTFTLPDVQVGSIIEYYYTINLDEYWHFNIHWILSEELFTKSAKFSLKPYENDRWPSSVRWSWQMLPNGTTEPKQGPDRIVRLEAHNIPAFQTEDFMPPEDELKSRVDFTYSDGPYESDVNKFWKNVGKKQNGKLEGFVGKRKAMEEAVAKIVSPSDSPETKLQKIYARVQQIRNTSYEVRKTGQEKERENEKDIGNVEEIWKRGYGSGQQLTWLYLALVRAAGFEAYGVWVSDRARYFFNRQIMNDKKLDANLVLVKLNGKDIFCDPGAAFTPFGQLPWTETGVQGLQLDKDGGTWIQTPLSESSMSRIERNANLRLTETGDLEGKLTIMFTGLGARRRRVEERNTDETERKKFLEDQVKEYIPANSEVELTNNPEWSSSTLPLVAEFTLKVPGWASQAGHRTLVPVGIFGEAEKRVFAHAERVHPIYFEYPFQEVDDVTIEPPLGWQITSLPPVQSQDGHIVTYTSETKSEKSTLHLTRKLTVDMLLLDQKYYAALRSFFQIVRAGDEQQIILQPATASTSH